MTKNEEKLIAALEVVLDQVDYTAGNCGPTEMVAACLSAEVIELARKAIREARGEKP